MDTEERAMLIKSEIGMLQNRLNSYASSIGDWKIIKIQEYVLAGDPAPYDINELHASRQAVRDQINDLQAELDDLEA